MSQMISSGSGRRDVLDEVAGLVGEVRQQPVDDLVRLDLHDVLDGGDLLRREALRHDRAEPEVLRIVHVDHRPEELVHLLGQVADVRALARAEQLRVAADVPDVVVAGDRPVARPGREREVGDLALVVVHEAGGVAQRLERAFAIGARRQPEFGVGQVEIVEADLVVRSEHRHERDGRGACRRRSSRRECTTS